MRVIRCFCGVILLVGALLCAPRSGNSEAPQIKSTSARVRHELDKSPHRCSRIVSLAPSLTELAFAVGLGPNVVGVTAYDRYPPEVTTLPSIGGGLNPSIERIVSLRPTMVLALAEMASTVEQLSAIGIATLVVDHRSVSGILASATTLGEKCGEQEAAAQLRQDWDRRIEEVRTRARGRGVRVLVTLLSADSLADTSRTYLSGADGFYAELIKITGATPVFERATVSLSGLSLEGIIAARPQVIFEISERALSEEEMAQRKKWWEGWLGGEARIVVLDSEYVVIPGPRFIEVLADIERGLEGNINSKGRQEGRAVGIRSKEEP